MSLENKFVDERGDKYKTRIGGTIAQYVGVVKECFSTDKEITYKGDRFNVFNGVMAVALFPLFLTATYVQTYQKHTLFYLERIGE